MARARSMAAAGDSFTVTDGKQIAGRPDTEAAY
jgi:hypothetical protein